MKITKKITSIVLALLLAVSAFAGLAITANAATASGEYTLKVYKQDVTYDASTMTGADYGNNIGNTSSSVGEEVTITNYKGLNGVTFKAYYQGNLTTREPATPDLTKISLTATTATVGGVDGVATFTVDGSSSKPYGLYYVVETSSPYKVDVQAKPFYVYLPTTNRGGDGFLRTTNVYPKNLTTLGGSTLTKTVNASAYDHSKISQAPQFELKDSAGNVIVTYTLADKVNDTPSAVVTTFDADSQAELVKKYSTVTASVENGIMVVNGLPTDKTYNADGSIALATDATYTWHESRPTILDGATDALPVATDQTFTVKVGYGSTAAIKDNAGVTTNVVASDNDDDDKTMDNSKLPTITKVADVETQTIGKNVVWTITPIVPDDIDSYVTYNVTDVIDGKLDFSYSDTDKTAVVVRATLAADKGTFTEGTDYTVSYDSTSRKFTFDTTQAGRQKLKGATELKIELTTQINANAVVNTDIENKATLTYENQYGVTGTPDSKDTVKTGGFIGLKYENVNSTEEKGLAGAEFELFEDANKTTKISFVYADGVYTVCKAGTEGAVSKITSENDGTFNVKGLAYGTYTLVETQAPAGYQLYSGDISVNVDATSYDSNAILADNKVVNVPTPDLPLTGGMGTILFTVAGLALIGGGAFFFIRSRKTRKEEI
ncbi:MAG: SpaH/EbpB family LPXTG-anchored major pilin [Acutalibacteraceae bacterium]